MRTPTTFLGRKAARATVKHSARGTASKVKRKPARTLTLVSVGAAAGAVGGWFAGRATSSGAAS